MKYVKNSNSNRWFRAYWHSTIGGAMHDGRLQQNKAFVRKPLSFTNPKQEQVIVDCANIRSFEEEISGDDFFSCLGTTKSKTPNQ